MQMAIYRSCVCLELNKLKSPLKCRWDILVWGLLVWSTNSVWYWVAGHRAGDWLTAVWACLSNSRDSKPQHCWGRCGTQVSASKTQLAASLTQFFCRVNEALDYTKVKGGATCAAQKRNPIAHGTNNLSAKSLYCQGRHIFLAFRYAIVSCCVEFTWKYWLFRSYLSLVSSSSFGGKIYFGATQLVYFSRPFRWLLEFIQSSRWL